METFREELNEDLQHVRRKPVPDNESARTRYIEQVHPVNAYPYAAPYGPHHAAGYYGHPGAKYPGGYHHPNGYFGGLPPPRRATSPQPRLSKVGGPRVSGGMRAYGQ